MMWGLRHTNWASGSGRVRGLRPNRPDCVRSHRGGRGTSKGVGPGNDVTWVGSEALERWTPDRLPIGLPRCDEEERVHRLSEIEITNFRSCGDCALPLADFTPLVGYNNGGKSNVLKGISWLLKKRTLATEDFFDPKAPVVISGRISGITAELLDRLDKRHRDRIEKFCRGGELRVRRTQPSPAGSLKNIQLDVWDPELNGGDWTKNPAGIDEAISALFPEPIEIGAMEDSAEDVAKHKSTTTIGKLIGEVVAPLEDRHGAAINRALDEVRSILEAEGGQRAPELKEFDDGANQLIQEFFPGISVALHVPPPEIKELFKAGTIKVYEGPDSPARDVVALGHGAQRSIQMALIRYLAEVKGQSGEAHARTLLLIDEPELFLHPQAVEKVRAALRVLSQSDYQVVFGTHSPQMVRLEDVADCLIVRKDSDGKTYGLPTLRAAVARTLEEAKSQAATLFEFENAAQVLFGDRVLIAEGKAEKRLLPEIYRLELGLTPGEDKTALVSLGGATNVANALRILTVMGVPAKAVVDLDYAFRGGVSAGILTREDADYQACRQRVTELASEFGFELAEDGFPKNHRGMTAEAAFALLATDPVFAEHVDALHERLLVHGIWLWTAGSFEHHLGITGKGEEVWADYAIGLRESGCEDGVKDLDGIRALLRWLRE